MPRNRKSARSNRMNPNYLAERLEGRMLLAADVVISELMAKNKKTLQDNFGDYSDWLELHNLGDASQDLTGWYLTDTQNNLTEWQFPAGSSLAPGAFQVVFASGRNIATLGQPLHTNFKLDDAGEYLALVQPDGATIQYQYAPTFPVQTSDISYGMADDDDPNSALQYFSLPTPGTANQPDAAAVTFSQPGGGYLSSIIVQLSSATPGAQIRYTKDGTVPTSTSPLYTTPISLAGDTMLRARAFATGFTSSLVTSQQYFILDSTAAAFHSNLPLVVVDSFGTSIGQTTQTAVSAAVYAAPTDGSDTTLTQTPQFVGRAGLDVRGQTSAAYPKQQYHFELWDESNNDKASSLLGMPSDSDWILYAPYSEKSLMQDQLAYKWANEMGMYAVHTQWVELFLNKGTDTKINYADDYAGIYLLEEKIKISPDRVDITKIGSGDDTDPKITGGYLWHKDKTDDSTEPSFTSQSGQTFLWEDPDSDKLDATQKAYLTGYINQFETALYGPNFTDPSVGYAKYIDVQSFVDNWIMVEMAKNIDGFRISTYYYKDRNGLIHMGPIWDYNLSMGNANYNGGDSATGWYHDNISAKDYTYFDRLTQDPNFMQLIAVRWQQLRQTIFSTPQITADIQSNVTLLTDGNGNIPVGPHPTQTPNNPVVRNFEKWDILGKSVSPNAYVGNSWTDEINYLTNFLTTRVAWMDTQLNPLAPTAIPGTPTGLTATALSGVQINLSWVPADNNATQFLIEQSTDGGATWSPSGRTVLGVKSYIAAGLTPSTSYLFRISALNTLGTSAVSASAPGTTTSTAPLLNLSTGFGTGASLMTANGKATFSSASLMLTDGGGGEIGSAFTNSRLNVLGFSTSFVFQLTNAVADGFTFTIQNNTPISYGNGSGGTDLGYTGIHTSLAIKFDLYNSHGEGSNSTGLFIDGDQPALNGTHAIDQSFDMTSSGVNIHTATQFLATLAYNGAILTETVTDMSSGAKFAHAYTVNIPSLLGASVGYAGFTGATGGSTAKQQILNWTYSSAPTVQNVIAGSATADTVSLKRSADQQYITWTIGTASGQIKSSDAAGLTFYGNGGTDTINLDYTNGNALPSGIHLYGTFLLNGLTGTNPLAGTTLDINQSTLYVGYVAGAPLSTIRANLATGYNAGTWKGAATATAGAITSWALQQTGTSTLGIGYVDSASGLIPSAPANTVELKVGLWGDTGLAGAVGFADMMRMTQHYTATGSTWAQGDFNYDGSVNSSDFNLLSPNYGKTPAFFDPVEVKTVALLPAATPAPFPVTVPTRPPVITTPSMTFSTVTVDASTKKAVHRAAKSIEIAPVPAKVTKPAKVKDSAKKK